MNCKNCGVIAKPITPHFVLVFFFFQNAKINSTGKLSLIEGICSSLHRESKKREGMVNTKAMKVHQAVLTKAQPPGWRKW